VDDHVSETEFLLEFFGLFGRDLGNPKQKFTDNPQDILIFVEENNKNKLPSFISVQPRKAHDKIFGIEKLFYDFDYGNKSDELSEKEIGRRKEELKIEVKKFVGLLMDWKPNIQPMVVKTRKGYHVYIYFDKVYSINGTAEFIKEVYATLMDIFSGAYESLYGKLKYLDPDVRKDVKRMSRVPLSIHEKSGQKCEFMKLKNLNFETDKVRGLGYFKNDGLKEENLKKAIKETERKLLKKKAEAEKKKEEDKQEWEMGHGFIGRIRPCFQVRMDSGEMGHAQRRALLVEAYYSGYNTEEKMVELFRCFHDFDGDKLSNSTCRYQIHYWFEREKPKPYECKTIQEHGWCLGEKCEIWKRRKEYGFKS
jgi:hypothetical protein